MDEDFDEQGDNLLPLSKHRPRNNNSTSAPGDSSDESQDQSMGNQGQTQLKCPVANCNAVYVRRPRYLDHLRAQHPDQAHLYMREDEDVRPYKCPMAFCDCSYVRKGDLKAHVMKVHADHAAEFPDILKPKSTKTGKEFPCPVSGCDCGYKRHSDLKYHFCSRHYELLRDYPEFGRAKPQVNIRTCRECNASFDDQVLLLLTRLLACFN